MYRRGKRKTKKLAKKRALRKKTSRKGGNLGKIALNIAKRISSSTIEKIMEEQIKKCVIGTQSSLCNQIPNRMKTTTYFQNKPFLQNSMMQQLNHDEINSLLDKYMKDDPQSFINDSIATSNTEQEKSVIADIIKSDTTMEELA